MKISNTITRLLKHGTFATALALAVTLQAQDDKSANPATDSKTARGQARANQEQLTATSFVKEATQSHLAEIALADTAIQKSQNAEVKQFAEHIKKDHTEANQKLQAIAQKNSIKTDTEVDAKHKAKQTELEAKSGAEFDQEYSKMMLKSHAKGISKYQQAAKLSDADVRSYAQETLPALRKHLQHGKDVAKAVGIDAATISSYSAEPADAVGGTREGAEVERGTGAKDKDKNQQPREESQP